MNINDVLQLLEKISQLSDVVINILVVGNINQSNSDNASISIFGNCCNSSPKSDFEVFYE